MNIFDPIRKKYIKPLPEEIIRNDLVKEMIYSLGYPKSSLSIEKKLKLLPHIKKEKYPNRRADIICFASGIHKDFELYPLILIECKKDKLNKNAFDQVIGYNYFVKAYFIALANKDEKIVFYKKKDKYESLKFLPTYRQLLDAVKNR